MSASIKKKVSQIATKQTNKQTFTTNDHFSAKSISEPNFTKSEGKVRFGQIFFWKWSSRRVESDATKQKNLSVQEVGQKRKIVVKIEFTPLSLSRPQNLKRIWKNQERVNVPPGWTFRNLIIHLVDGSLLS